MLCREWRGQSLGCGITDTVPDPGLTRETLLHIITPKPNDKDPDSGS